MWLLNVAAALWVVTPVGTGLQFAPRVQLPSIPPSIKERYNWEQAEVGLAILPTVAAVVPPVVAQEGVPLGAVSVGNPSRPKSRPSKNSSFLLLQLPNPHP
jgi:hypothetical protein